MTNARMFQEVFGLYATEVWSFTEERFLEWLNDTYLENEFDINGNKMGKWYDRGSLSCRCSNCGCKNTKETPYCPWCGAKMEIEK